MIEISYITLLTTHLLVGLLSWLFVIVYQAKKLTKVEFIYGIKQYRIWLLLIVFLTFGIFIPSFIFGIWFVDEL